MGMDLYKYRIENEEINNKEDSYYIGKNLTKKQIEDISHLKTKIEEEIKNSEIEKAIDEVLKLNGILEYKKLEEEIFWDFRVLEKRPLYILISNEKTKERYKQIMINIDKAFEEKTEVNIGYKEEDELYKEVEDTIQKLYNNEMKKEKNIFKNDCSKKVFNTSLGKLYIYNKDKLKINNQYYLETNNLKNINYIRKPFRHVLGESKIKNKEIFNVGNWTGVDHEKLNIFLKKTIYNNSCRVFMTSKHNYLKNDMKELVDKYMIEHIENLFPIKNNEFISIDW